MMSPPEGSPLERSSRESSGERDAALDGLLPHVAAHGWSLAAVRAGLCDRGRDPGEADFLFAGGGAELVEAYLDLVDRRMAADVAAMNLAGLRTAIRIRAAVAARLNRLGPHRPAMRRAAGMLALPGHARLALRCTARTADAIWNAAGDRSADFSWYTKRVLLGGIYAATLLFWLRREEVGDAATLDFLDRRLAATARIGGLRKRAERLLRLPEGLASRFRPRRDDGADAGFAEA